MWIRAVPSAVRPQQLRNCSFGVNLANTVDLHGVSCPILVNVAKHAGTGSRSTRSNPSQSLFFCGPPRGDSTATGLRRPNSTVVVAHHRVVILVRGPARRQTARRDSLRRGGL